MNLNVLMIEWLWVTKGDPGTLAECSNVWFPRIRVMSFNFQKLLKDKFEFEPAWKYTELLDK